MDVTLCCYENFLLALDMSVCQPVKAKNNTLKVERCKFAQVGLEIELNRHVVGREWLEGYWYKMEYRALHVIGLWMI